MESENQTTVSQATPQVIYQPSGDPKESPKNLLGVARVVRTFRFHCASKAAERY